MSPVYGAGVNRFTHPHRVFGAVKKQIAAKGRSVITAIVTTSQKYNQRSIVMIV